MRLGQVYFSLKNDSNLVIKAKRKSGPGDSHILELIPQDKLKGDLPALLIEGHAHWLNLSTSIIEIRPLDSLWEASSENWTIDCTLGQYRMQKGSEFLVDIRSQSWAMVSRLLQPLDTPQNLLVSASQIDSSEPMTSLQLSVSLPRYGLSFYVDKDGDLQSHNMRGMVYDEDQSIGTLFGLVNRLVLRPKIRDPDAVELIPRCVLIPDGEISFQKDGHHVRIEVNTPRPALERVTYQTYKVDIDLSCLTGNVSLTNKLYCVYLHALTSGCSTDPLTGRTGTEEALSLLRSASCSSIMRFGAREAELLGLIASICPVRTWYPEHLKCMQKVEWHDLPAITQHHELYIASKAIKSHYERVQMFLENQSGHLFPRFPKHDDDLLQRSALRAAYLFPSEFSGCQWPSGVNHDVQYSARHLLRSGERRACIAATSVIHGTTHAMTKRSLDILSMVESWEDSVSGTAALSLQYDNSWLTPNLPLIWLEAYKLLRRVKNGGWFQILFSLPAMAYASPNLSDLVPMFVAFARSPRFRWEDPPPHDSYDLAEGYCPSAAALRSYVSDTFEHGHQKFTPRRDERGRGLENKLKLFNERRKSDINAAVQKLIDTWPCETRLWGSVNSDVQRHFSSYCHNFQLKEHLTRVQDILNDIFAKSSPIPAPRYSFQPSQSIPFRTSWSITLDLLFTRPAPRLPEHVGLLLCTVADANTPLSDPAPLDQLLATAEANAKDTFQGQYVSALRASAECFRRDSVSVAHGETNLPTAKMLFEHHTSCEDSYIEALHCVKQHLWPRTKSELALAQSGQWPRITAHALFGSLASNSLIVLPDDWKKCLIRFTLLALRLQRARRLLRLHLDNLREELRWELQNRGWDGWDADAYPDWLLIQVCLVRYLYIYHLTRRLSPTATRQLFGPARSGRGCHRNDITKFGQKYCHATQHG